MRDHLGRDYQRRLAEGLPGADVVGRAALPGLRMSGSQGNLKSGLRLFSVVVQ